jgi:hypothetical protein
MTDVDPSMSRLALSFLAMTVMLALTILGMRAVSRFLGRSRPKGVVQFADA